MWRKYCYEAPGVVAFSAPQLLFDQPLRGKRGNTSAYNMGTAFAARKLIILVEMRTHTRAPHVCVCVCVLVLSEKYYYHFCYWQIDLLITVPALICSLTN